MRKWRVPGLTLELELAPVLVLALALGLGLLRTARSLFLYGANATLTPPQKLVTQQPEDMLGHEDANVGRQHASVLVQEWLPMNTRCACFCAKYHATKSQWRATLDTLNYSRNQH